jgi:hypothetical protein
MDEELRLHMELQGQHHERLGAAPADARTGGRARIRRARRVKESYRDARGVRPLENLVQDARYAVRTLVHQRAFTLTAVLTFAIGLGATTAIFTLLNTTWFSWSRAFQDADRITMLYKTLRTGGNGPTSPFDFRDWQREARSFAGVAGYMRTGVRLTTATEPVAVPAVATTSNFLAVLGVRPALGRFLREDEERWGRNNVVVLSSRSWQRDFAADPRVLGRRVMVDGIPSEIVGSPHGAHGSARTCRMCSSR